MMVLKPFIYKNRKSPRLVAMDKDTDEQVFMRKKLLYSVEMRCNAGYGYYEMAVKVVNT
jgi:phage major head subunit gpT-like protein